MWKAIVLAVLFFSVVSASNPFDYSKWDDVLHKYVSPGELEGIQLNVVNYTGMSNDQNFTDFLDQIANASLNSTLTDEQFYSFYINTYNALACHMIIKHACKEDLFGKCGTLKSIRDITTWIPYKAVWDQDAGVVAGEHKSLQEVEDLLRSPPSPLREDARLHSAIVCASISCPNLRNEAYTMEKLWFQLEDNWNDFMNNTKKGMSVDKDAKKITLSSIFDWFSSDFENNGTDIPTFIAEHLFANNTNKAWLLQYHSEVSISYFDYNWDVNAKGKLPCDSSDRPCYQLWALLLTIAILVIVSVVVIIIVAVRRYKQKKRSGYHSLN